MAIIASWAGAGLTDGAAVGTSTVGTGDDALNTVTASTWTVDESGARPPRLQMDQQAATAAQAIWATATLGTLTNYAVRGYLQMSAWPSAGAPILQMYSSSSLRWRLDVTSAGLLRLRDASNTVVDTAGVALPVGAELRVEVSVTGTTATAYAYLGDAVTPGVSLTGTVGAGADEVRWGNTQTSPTWPTCFWDELAVADTADLIGPVPAVFPDAAIDVRIELLLGTWTDITKHAYTRDPITITGGRADEGSQSDPGRCTVTINNNDGRYSPRNPNSPYSGVLGRNTPIRVSVPYGETYLALDGDDRANTPDSVALSITGDIDVRVDVTADSWRAGGILMSKARYSGTERDEWVLWTGVDGLLNFWWSPTGAFAAHKDVRSTMPIPVTQGRRAVRATVDVDNGAGGWTVRFYTAPTMTGAWTQLGDAVTGAGTSSIYNGNAPVDLGKNPELSFPGQGGRYHAAEIRSGIGGTVVSSLDLTRATPAAATTTDAQGNVWTLVGDAALTDRDIRFAGEVPSWPVRWGPSGADVHVTIEAAGILRRLGQGAKPLRSAVYRAITSLSPPLPEYWPLEDGEASTVAASGVPGRLPMRVTGRPAFGAAGAPVGGSTALGFADGGKVAARVAMSTAPDGWMVSFFLTLPEEIQAADVCASVGWTTPNGASYFRFQTLITSEDPIPDNIGRMILAVFDSTGTAGFPSMATKNLLGRTSLITITGEYDVGAGLFMQFYVDGVASGDSLPGSDYLIDEPASTIGWATVNEIPIGNTLTSVPAVGEVSHLMVGTADRVDAMHALAVPAAAGYAGESAYTRIVRLAREEGVPVQMTGLPEMTPAMGPQQPKPLLELLGEAADVDGGVLGERRDALSLAYRCRTTIYNQTPALTLDYHDDVAAGLEPVDDDEAIRNDITVEREGGSSVRVLQEDGPLSIAAPPDGVGLYDESVTINVDTDEQLANQAGWRLHLGTVDETRYPAIGVKLHKHPGLIRDVVALGPRSLIRMTDPPAWLPPEDVDLLAEGYTEVIEPLRWWIDWNAIPGTPWRVGVVDVDRYDTAGAALASSATATATSLSVSTTLGPLWTTAAADMPMDIRIGGEQITVTAISGSSSPQTFTVTRSVNGVVKAHAAGAAVSLWAPAVYAL